MAAVQHLIPAERDALSSRFEALHENLLAVVPAVDRMACALYHAEDDRLTTFVSSNRNGEPLKAYEYPLAASASLSELVKSRAVRLIRDIPNALGVQNAHSRWVLESGFRSSFTIPLFDHDALLGFLFFDSREEDAFSEAAVNSLSIYGSVVSLLLSNAAAHTRAVKGCVELAKDFSDLRDFETGHHIARMSRYSRLIAKSLCADGLLSDETVEQIYRYAPLHDIGKIGVPDRVLLKQGKLDRDEWELMKTHVVRGRDMINHIIEHFALGDTAETRVMRNVVRYHHECVDGTGYPDGLKGEQIPIEARIVSVADIFDALTSERPYKARWTNAQAFAELDSLANSGKLDAACVTALVAQRAEIECIQQRFFGER